MESNDFRVYRRFADKNLATTYTEILKEHSITYVLDELQNNYNILIPNSNAPKEYLLKIGIEDFEKVDSIFLDYEKDKIQDVDNDYYLYSFTNDELIEVITNFEEWSEYDYLLAQKILDDRDFGLDQDKIKALQNKRVEEIAKPHKGSTFLISLGYLFAFMGGIIGIAIGYNLAYHKKLLPDNRLVPYYTAKTRRQGLNIFWISILSFFTWTILVLMRQ